MPHPVKTMSKNILDEIIRVDHAGECGAKRIYEGQIKALKGSDIEPVLQHMYKQELHHLHIFDTLMQEHHVRPTVFSPLWHHAAYALGWASGRLGTKTAMAVTIAVEEVIDEHYQSQHDLLKQHGLYPHVQQYIEDFRQDELEHRDQAIHLKGEEAPAYKLLHQGVRALTKLAIAVSKRL